MRLSANGLWGRANYFAADARYSNAYCHRSTQMVGSVPVRQMLLAKVRTPCLRPCVWFAEQISLCRVFTHRLTLFSRHLAPFSHILNCLDYGKPFSIFIIFFLLMDLWFNYNSKTSSRSNITENMMGLPQTIRHSCPYFVY